MSYQPGFSHITLDTTGATIPPMGLNQEQKSLYKFTIMGARRGRQLESRYSGSYKHGQAVADGDSYFNLMKAKSDDSLYPFKNPSMDNLSSTRPALSDYIAKADSIIGWNAKFMLPGSPPPHPSMLIPSSIVSAYSAIKTHLVEIQNNMFGSGVQVSGNISRNMIQHTSMLSGVDQISDGQYPALPGINGIMNSNNQILNGLGQNFKDMADNLLSAGLNEGSSTFQNITHSVLAGVENQFTSVLDGVDFPGVDSARTLVSTKLDLVSSELTNAVKNSLKDIGTIDSDDVVPIASNFFDNVSGSLKNIVGDISGSLAGLGGGIVGGELSGVFGGALNNITDDVSGVVENILKDSFGGFGNVLDSGLEGVVDNFSSGFSSILSGGTDKIASIADSLLDDMVNFDMGNGIQNILGDFSPADFIGVNAGGYVGDLVDNLGGLVSGNIPGLGDMISDVTSMISGDIGSLTDAMDLVGDFSMGGMIDGMVGNFFGSEIMGAVAIEPIQGLASSITGVGIPAAACGLGALGGGGLGGIAGGGGLSDIAGGALGDMAGGLGEVAGGLGSIAGGALGGLGDIASGALDGLGGLAGGLGDLAGELNNMVGGALGDITTGLGDLAGGSLNDLMGNIEGLAGGAFGELDSFASGIVGELGGALNGLGDLADSFADGAFNGISDLASGAFDSLPELGSLAGGALGTIDSLASNIVDNLGNSLMDSFSGIAGDININSVLNGSLSVDSLVKGSFETVLLDLQNSAEGIIDDKVGDVILSINETVGGVVSNINNEIQNSVI